MLLERADRPATEASANNGALTWPYLQMLGEQYMYRLVRDGIEAHRRLSEEGLNYDFRKIGAIQVYYDDRELQNFVRQLETLPSTERYESLSSEGLHGLEPEISRAAVGGVLFPDCSQGTPDKLCRELVARLRQKGATILASTEVRGFDKGPNKVRSAITGRGEVKANHFVIATGPWSNEFSDNLGFGIPTIPIKGHIVKWKTERPLLSHLVMGPRGSIFPVADGIKAGGGMDYTGYDKTPNERVVRILSDNCIQAFPALASLKSEVWTGLRPGTPDSLPIIGHASPYENLVIASGAYHEGFTISALTGEVVADLVTEGSSDLDYLSMYKPTRFNC